jgi:prophage regulatory protein
MRVMRLGEVMKVTGLGRSSIYKLQSEGLFPRSISLSERAIGWYAYEVEAWLQEKLDARDALRIQGDAFSQLPNQYPRC